MDIADSLHCLGWPPGYCQPDKTITGRRVRSRNECRVLSAVLSVWGVRQIPWRRTCSAPPSRSRRGNSRFTLVDCHLENKEARTNRQCGCEFASIFHSLSLSLSLDNTNSTHFPILFSLSRFPPSFTSLYFTLSFLLLLSPAPNN